MHFEEARIRLGCGAGLLIGLDWMGLKAGGEANAHDVTLSYRGEMKQASPFFSLPLSLTRQQQQHQLPQQVWDGAKTHAPYPHFVRSNSLVKIDPIYDFVIPPLDTRDCSTTRRCCEALCSATHRCSRCVRYYPLPPPPFQSRERVPGLIWFGSVYLVTTAEFVAGQLMWDEQQHNCREVFDPCIRSIPPPPIPSITPPYFPLFLFPSYTFNLSRGAGEQVMQNNPQLAQVLNDPATMRQYLEMARNPAVSRWFSSVHVIRPLFFASRYIHSLFFAALMFRRFFSFFIIFVCTACIVLA